MNIHTGEIVRIVSQSNHKETVKLCVSQLALFWINNLSLMEFQVTYLDLFHLFSVLNNFGWFWVVIIAIYIDDTTLYSRCNQGNN